jgi:hypothetical protein
MSIAIRSDRSGDMEQLKIIECRWCDNIFFFAVSAITVRSTVINLVERRLSRNSTVVLSKTTCRQRMVRNDEQQQ